MRIFSTTWSPSCGSSPSAGAAPHVPRTSAFASRTPSKSGAFCFSPGAPASTMYQMWITGTPALRHAAASPFTFSTTFCAIAWAGAPESAKAPPSMITSFWRSWITRAAEFGSMRSICLLLMHVAELVAGDLHPYAVDRGRGRDVERAPVVVAPVDVADALRHLDRAEMLAVRREDPDAVGAGDVDVALLVELHPVDEAALRQVAVPDVLGEHAAVGKRVVRADVEHADVRARRVVDVEQRLVGREAKPVRLLEIVDEQLDVAATGGEPVDALEVEILLALEPEARHAPVRRVGEDDRAVPRDEHIVRAVQILALPVRGERLAGAIRLLPHDGARDVLADDQVAVVVERHAVALVARVAQHRNALGRVPAAALVARHVAEMERPVGHPDRAFGEGEPGRDLLDLGVLVDELAQLLGMQGDGHPLLLFACPGDGANVTGGCRTG